KQGYSAIPVGENIPSVAPSISKASDVVGRVKRSPALLGILTAAALAAGFCLALLLPVCNHELRSHPYAKVVKPGISDIIFQERLHKCHNLQRERKFNITKQRRNPKARQVAPVLLKNAVVWDGQGKVFKDMDVLLEDGGIKDIRHQIQVVQNVKAIDDNTTKTDQSLAVAKQP
ncbi:hypothetical protein EC973_006069, partial [Apophysomyces ossiformis]